MGNCLGCCRKDPPEVNNDRTRSDVAGTSNTNGQEYSRRNKTKANRTKTERDVRKKAEGIFGKSQKNDKNYLASKSTLNDVREKKSEHGQATTKKIAHEGSHEETKQVAQKKTEVTNKSQANDGNSKASKAPLSDVCRKKSDLHKLSKGKKTKTSEDEDDDTSTIVSKKNEPFILYKKTLKLKDNQEKEKSIKSSNPVPVTKETMALSTNDACTADVTARNLRISKEVKASEFAGKNSAEVRRIPTERQPETESKFHRRDEESNGGEESGGWMECICLTLFLIFVAFAWVNLFYWVRSACLYACPSGWFGNILTFILILIIFF